MPTKIGRTAGKEEGEQVGGIEKYFHEGEKMETFSDGKTAKPDPPLSGQRAQGDSVYASRSERNEGKTSLTLAYLCAVREIGQEAG